MALRHDLSHAAVRLLSRGHVGQVLAAVAAAGSAAASVATGHGLRHAHRHDATTGRGGPTAAASAPPASSPGPQHGPGKSSNGKITLPQAFDGIPGHRPVATSSKATWNKPSPRGPDWSYVSEGIRRLEDMLAQESSEEPGSDS
jgi:hypothetical protein